MNSKISLWLLVITSVWLSSCHKNRISRTARTTTTDATDSASFDAGTAKIKEIVFEYLTAKSKFSFKSRKQDIDNTNINIRMKKDSLIWISVNGLGLEVARGLITRDSIVFMDKIHKDYFVFNYQQLSHQHHFNVNFDLFQSIVIGNLLFPQNTDHELEKQGEFFLLRQAQDSISIENYINAENLKLNRLHAVQAGSTNNFTLLYDDFKEVSGFLFPFSSSASLLAVPPDGETLSETNIKLKHSKVELMDTSPGFPFNIPSSYSRKR